MCSHSRVNWSTVKLVISLLIVHSLPTTAMVPALVIIDVQDCFLKGGSLAVNDGNSVIDVINRIRVHWHTTFKLNVLTKDWHCQNHVSFASSHTGYKPFEDINLNYTLDGKLCSSSGSKVKDTVSCTGPTKTVNQKLWPDHCIANVSSGSTSSEVNKDILKYDTDTYIFKGDNCQHDSYSAFWDNGNFSMTQLDSVLRSNGITHVYFVGLALDYCVFESARDSNLLGHNTYVVRDATRPVDNTTGENAVRQLQEAGVHIITSDQLDEMLMKETDIRKNKANNRAETSSAMAYLLALTCTSYWFIMMCFYHR